MSDSAPAGGEPRGSVDLANHDLAALGVFAMVLMGVLTVPYFVANGAVPLGVLSGVSCAFMIVYFATLRLEVVPDGLYVRQWPRLNRIIRWEEIEQARSVWSGSPTGMTSCLGLQLVSGKTIKCRSVAGYGRNAQPVTDAVDLIESRLAMKGQEQRR